MTSLLQLSFSPVAGHPRRRRQQQRIVASADRQALFSRIAPVYDNLNDVLSLGQHRIWKRMAVDWSGQQRWLSVIYSLRLAKEGSNVLDLCCGSGDLAFLLSPKVGVDGQKSLGAGRAVGYWLAISRIGILYVIFPTYIYVYTHTK
ncbi:putative ubiE/COQ5 methyltransferase, S-adenosyl-L-methionine-dependent methyltransferase [Helianthus anomalus]